MSVEEDRMRKVMLNGDGPWCPKCDTPLEIVELPRLGMGDNATMNMLYCPDCDEYYSHFTRIGGTNEF